MGIYRVRQGVLQRITPNAGNRTVIAGGKGTNRQVTPPVGRQMTPPPPPAAKDEP